MIPWLEKDHKFALILSDLVAVIVASVLAMLIRFGGFESFGIFSGHGWKRIAALVVGLGLLWFLALCQVQAYSLFPSRWSEVYRLFKASVLYTLILVAVAFFSFQLFSRTMLLVLIPTLVCVTLLSRRTVAPLLLRLVGRIGIVRILLIGKGEIAEELHRRLSTRHGYLVTLVDTPADVPGSMASLLAVHQPAEVVFSCEQLPFEDMVTALNICQRQLIPWQFVPTLNQLVFANVRTQFLEGIPLISVQPSSPTGFSMLLKRALDVSVSIAMLLALAPPMLLIWLAIRMTTTGPAIITQKRVGRNLLEFDFYKFRTMYVTCDDAAHRAYVKQWVANRPATGGEQVFKMVRDPRVTPVGGFLRRFSLDELPQIFNVLKAEMSLVGPRPSLPYEVEGFQQWHLERFHGLPGITGLWQVSGRNRLSFDEMVKLDIEYLRNWTLAQDLKVLIRTIPTVLGGSGF